jgi:hypothetical protein
MSIDCNCDICKDTIETREPTYCKSCYDRLVDIIKDLEDQVRYLENLIQEAKDE